MKNSIKKKWENGKLMKVELRSHYFTYTIVLKMRNALYIILHGSLNEDWGWKTEMTKKDQGKKRDKYEKRWWWGEKYEKNKQRKINIQQGLLYCMSNAALYVGPFSFKSILIVLFRMSAEAYGPFPSTGISGYSYSF